MAASIRTFTPIEIGAAIGVAIVIEVGFFLMLVFASLGRLHIEAKEPAPPRETSIAVKPVIDDLPLLKLGSKRVRAKLPDMWKKQAPVKRYEEASAPSPLAPKIPEAIPSSPLAKRDAEAPPPDAAIAKQVDQTVDAGAKETPNLPTEGAADGVKEGTEKDPMKARAVDLYKYKLASWFQRRLPPISESEIPCAELKKLGARFVANIDANRNVTSYTTVSMSGNAVFDAKAKRTMDSSVGQELPPPPTNYPDILQSALRVVLDGKDAACK